MKTNKSKQKNRRNDGHKLVITDEVVLCKTPQSKLRYLCSLLGLPQITISINGDNK